ncbi:sensor histidine kinase [Terriglobus roseus]|uniref:sensor histidine kinase n=1 Tax=Terriglobus roseus TaxID=392734 RepID=UPI0002F2F26A|nr:sensor histidine kinase [Terriglobus roseus]
MSDKERKGGDILCSGGEAVALVSTGKPNIAKQHLSGMKVLWVGCAFILAVMCVSTADIIYSLRKTSIRSDAVISAFRERTHLLDTLRALMLRSALSPNNAGERAMDESQLPTTHLQASKALEDFGRSLEASGDDATQQRLADLKTSIDRYWESLPDIRQQNGKLRDSIQPRAGSPERRQIRRITRQINALNREQQDRTEAKLHEEHQRLQGELLLASLLSLAAVIALVTGMSYRLRASEGQAESQYQAVVQARNELRNLTARLEQAQEEERRTLSRELHDEFGQTMAAALVELSRIEDEMIHDGGTRAQLARVKLALEQSMRSIRDIALALRPSMLDDLGLVPALRWQGREVARRHGLAVSVDADDNAGFLPDAYRTCIFRVVQEALHNTVKHASAKSARVVFQRTDDAMTLKIEDDGKGFRPDLEKGLGLLGIEERVSRLSGQVHVTSTVNNGTSVFVTLPQPATLEDEIA